MTDAGGDARTGGSARGPTVLVLGGGGSRGALEIGMLRALGEVGFAPDICVGTSVGALNAAMAASTTLADAADRLEVLCTSAVGRAVFGIRFRDLAQSIAARRPWIRTGDALRALVRHALADLGISEFDELSLPLHVVVCDLLRGRTEVLHEGSLEDALVASCSIPGVFAPVHLANGVYVDGGVMENCAISVAVGLSPAHIVAIDVTTEAEVVSIGRWIDVVDRVLGLGQQARVRADYALYSADVPITLLLPCPSRPISSLDTVDAVQLSQAAASATRRAMPSLLAGNGTLRPGMYEIPVPLPDVTLRRRADADSAWAPRGSRSRLLARWRTAQSGTSEVPPDVVGTR